METLYNDFTTNILPKINEGLSMTKDYFFDLFGRYVKFLIVKDLIGLGIALILIVVLTLVFKKLLNWARTLDEYDKTLLIIFGSVVFTLIVGSIFFIGVVENTLDLAKTIYIPEVRVLEEIQSYQNRN